MTLKQEEVKQKEAYDERQINFRETVQPGQGVRTTRSFFLPGKITQVMFHFPPGCAGLVQVKLEKDKRPFYPLQGYLALDNATPVYYVEAPYYAYEPLDFTVLNTDAVNPHTVSCTVVIRFKRPPWW